MRAVIDWLTCWRFSWLELLAIASACVIAANWAWLPQAALVFAATAGSILGAALLRRLAGLPSPNRKPIRR